MSVSRTQLTFLVVVGTTAFLPSARAGFDPKNPLHLRLHGAARLLSNAGPGVLAASVTRKTTSHRRRGIECFIELTVHEAHRQHVFSYDRARGTHRFTTHDSRPSREVIQRDFNGHPPTTFFDRPCRKETIELSIPPPGVTGDNRWRRVVWYGFKDCCGQLYEQRRAQSRRPIPPERAQRLLRRLEPTPLRLARERQLWEKLLGSEDGVSFSMGVDSDGQVSVSRGRPALGDSTQKPVIDPVVVFAPEDLARRLERSPPPAGPPTP